MIDQAQALELLGYAASLLVAASLMMRSFLRLRWVNLAGALAFAVYGVAIEAWPVAIVNIFIAGINIYYLRQMLGRQPFVSLLSVAADDRYLLAFLDHYGEDIRRYQPGFRLAQDDDRRIALALRDMVPAGLVVARADADRPEVLRIDLDYVIAGYRDLKIGRWLYNQSSDLLRDQPVPIRHILATPGSPDHRRYLRRMGFAADGLRYRLDLPAPEPTGDDRATTAPSEDKAKLREVDREAEVT